MKKLLTLLCAVAALCGTAQNSALFVYQKQGGLTPLLFSEVDSITFSYFDIDSVEYNVPVTQDIWTPDSIYRIPLCEIDSVSFQTPATVLKERTVDLTLNPIRQYVTDASMENMTVSLAPNTPSNLIPKSGDYLVAMEYGGVFGIGFVGQATSVSTNADGETVISCTEADLTDAFDCYYGVFQSVGYNQEDTEITPQSAMKAARMNVNEDGNAPMYNSVKTFHLKPSRWFIKPTELDIRQLMEIENIFDDIKTRYTMEVEHPLSIEGGINIQISPILTIGHMTIIRWNKFYQRTSMMQTDKLTIEGRLMGHAGKSFELNTSLNRLNPEIPLMYFLDLEVGGSVGVNATVGLEHYLEATSYRSYILERTNPLTPGKATWQNGISDFKNQLNLIMDGSFSIELYFTPMVKLFHKNLASLQAKFYGGIELAGNFMFNLDQYDTCEQSSLLYSSLKGKGWHLLPFAGAKIIGQHLVSSTTFFDYPFTTGEPLASSLTVPTIDKLTVSPNGIGNSEVSVTVSGNCITPHRIGLRVVKNEGTDEESVHEWIDEENKYWTSIDGLNYTHEFEMYIDRATDKVYPLVEYYGRMIVANPSWPSEPRRDIIYPYTSYLSKNQVRVISGATTIRDGRSETSAVQEGNFLPFTYFTPQPLR